MENLQIPTFDNFNNFNNVNIFLKDENTLIKIGTKEEYNKLFIENEKVVVIKYSYNYHECLENVESCYNIIIPVRTKYYITDNSTIINVDITNFCVTITKLDKKLSKNTIILLDYFLHNYTDEQYETILEIDEIFPELIDVVREQHPEYILKVLLESQ